MNTNLATKKLLFVAPSAYPLGGVQTWLDYIVPGLANLTNNSEAIFETAIALTSGQHHDTNKYLQAHPFNNVHILENQTGLIEGRARVIENLLSEFNPDIVLVVNITDVYQAVINLRAKGNRQIRVATTLHGIHPGLIDDINRYHNVIDAVMVTNKLTAKLVIEKTQIKPNRVQYAPYGVTILDDSVLIKQDQDIFTVAYVGRIEDDQKRISDLLLIFEDLLRKQPNTTILIAGDGPEKDMSKFKAWLKRQANPNIHYLGVLNSEQLRDKVYQVSDVMLLTSHWETGPIVAWEAFQYDLTLVSSKYIGFLEEGSLVHEQNCLMFDIGDTQHAVKLLLQAQSKELRQQLRQNSRSLLRSKYSQETSITTWGAELEAVAARPAKLYYKQQKQKTDKSRILSIFRFFLGIKADRIYEYFHLFLKRKFKHQSSGSEWPHSYSKKNSKSNQLTRYISSSSER